MELIVVYHWLSGAYLNSYDGEEFDAHFLELCEDWGPPVFATTYFSDWLEAKA